jgi:hypothetical protein
MKTIQKYYKLNEETDGQDLAKILQGLDPNLKMDEADLVIDPDGNIINMVKVRSIIGDAIDGLATMVDQSLAEYIANMNIVYTYNDCPTFQTDGKRIAINPTFCMNIYQAGADKTPDGEDNKGLIYVAYVLLHELFHVMLGHCEDPRVIDLVYKGSLENDRVNYSMDAVINWMIENSSYDADDNYFFKGVTKECGGVIDEMYNMMDWPEVYEKVPDEDVMRDMDSVVFKHIDPIPNGMTDDWYNGFLDGYNEMLDMLKKQRLIESVGKIYHTNSLLEGNSNNNVITSILHAKGKTPEEKAQMIYDLLGDDINGDEEATDDMTSGGASGGAFNGTSGNDDEDVARMSEYDKGKIYGTTFAAYIYNCNGNSDYVKKHIFPDIQLPDVPAMKKLNKDSMLNIGAIVDLGAITDELLKDKNVKII